MKTLFILTCKRTGETQDVICCENHGQQMPVIDGEWLQAYPADSDIDCEFCDTKKETREVASRLR